MLIAKPAKVSHAYHLAPRLRAEDKAEIQAGSGEQPLPVLLRGIRECRTFTVFDPIVPVALFGVGPTNLPNVGCCWLLSTPELFNQKRQFIRESRLWFKELHRDYRTLWNRVAAFNTVHRRWLSWLGVRWTHEEDGFHHFIHQQERG